MNRFLERLDSLQRRHRVLGLPIAVFKRFGEHGGGRLVTTVAYWSFFSIFPLLLVFVAVLNTVLADDPELRQDLVDGALGQVPLVGSELADSQAGLSGSWVTIVVGAATALWAGLAVANALQTALDEIWDTPMFERPNGLVQRGRALAFLLILAVGLCASTIAISATSFLDASWLTLAMGLLVTFAVNVAILLSTFWLLISGRNSLRQLLPGVILAAVLLVALQSLGRFVVTRYIAGASDTYGTFAIVFALLSWFFLVARVVLMAAELNSVLRNRLTPRSLTGGGAMTEGDRRAVLFDARRVQRDRRVGVAVSIDAADAAAFGDEVERAADPA